MRAEDASPMWIDTPAADARLEAMATTQPELAQHLRDFARDGYVILKGAVAPETIDAYVAAFDAAAQNDETIMVSYGRDVLPIVGQNLRRPLVKILDTHVKLKAAQPLAFAPPVMAFIKAVFESPVLAFQSLHFELGSTQALHQDTAYVVLDEPRRMVAAWIALEDIKPGSGELVYYPGSHRFPEYLYPGDRKHWNPPEDGDPPHDRHLKRLHEQAAEHGVPLSGFLAEKGDVLVWHADLAHGGSKITDKTATRRSLAVHYAPADATPHYFQFVDEARRRKVPAGEHCVSTYYYAIDDALFAPPPKAEGFLARMRRRLGLS